MGGVAGGTLGYLAVEGAMRDNQHPIHYVVTILVAVAGWWAGKGWYRWKGRGTG